jgi:recombinational DNA repair protein (RecF pathway)
MQKWIIDALTHPASTEGDTLNEAYIAVAEMASEMEYEEPGSSNKLYEMLEEEGVYPQESVCQQCKTRYTVHHEFCMHDMCENCVNQNYNQKLTSNERN